MRYILACDLGTGGIKTSIIDEHGELQGFSFQPYQTYYNKMDYKEQNPIDWWNAVIITIHDVIKKTAINTNKIISIAISGHSLGVVPIDVNGNLLCNLVPIWSDSRAKQQISKMFTKVNEKEWYLSTGNGFPPELYSIFKIMWYKDNMPDVYNQCYKFIGTKDFINYKLTGVICTDHSYASGSGVYSLENHCYNRTYVQYSGIEEEKLPSIVESTEVLGKVLPNIAKELGLSTDTVVCAGGVDNACMALGAACIDNGETYTSLGTSAWIAVCNERPILNYEKRPYVFVHCVPGMYISSTCIFSSGSSMNWIIDNIFNDLVHQNKDQKHKTYETIEEMANQSRVGSNGLLFIPTLAGGCSLDKSVNIRGGLIGLNLSHTRQDIARATLEGISMNLKLALDVLQEYVPISENMLLVGGGAKNKLWQEIFADIYSKNIVISNIGQDAGTLGAAAIAAVGVGLWDNFDKVKQLHHIQHRQLPNKEHVDRYNKLIPVYKNIMDSLCMIGDQLEEVKRFE